jgi:tetratricopeptide (TPR) repeat protein
MDKSREIPTLIGVVILIAILVVRWAVGYWRGKRLWRWWNKGQEALNVGNFVAAEAAFRECLRLAPIAGPVHRVLGGVLLHRGKLAEAEERLRFGADLEPRNPAGHLDLGFFLALCVPNRSEEAIDAFAAAIAAAPDVRQRLSAEPRLESLRRNERFRTLLESPGSPPPAS